MAKQLQLRRGTTAEHASFTGAVGELTIDADKDTAVVHDAYQAGGFPLLREDLNNLANSSIPITKITPGTALHSVRSNAAGTAAEFFDSLAVTMIFQRGTTTGGHTATMNQSIENFQILWFRCAEWSNIVGVPVDYIKGGQQIMLDTYDNYHSYVSYSNNTTLVATAGTGNTFYEVWGAV